MHRIGVIAIGSVIALAATAAYGQETSQALSRTLHATSGPYYFSGDLEHSYRESPTTLFTIGGLEVHVWTPVAPPYNTAADRNLAADPMLSTQ